MAKSPAHAPKSGRGGAGRLRKRGLRSERDRVKAAHPGKRLTLWFQDEARFGQKGRVCHRWFTRGKRPPGLCDGRYTWAHLFAAVQPETGQGFALVLPEMNTATMSLFLARFAQTLAPDEHAVMVVDQAGWHVTQTLAIPDNVSLIFLPPYSPQLNPVERVWLYLRERFLSHRILDTYDAILDALCQAWNTLTPQRLQTLTQYPYLNQVNA